MIASTVNEEEKDLLSLAGRTAVVTGASSGIGLGTARLLAEKGARVALIDVDEEGGLAAEKEIKEKGGTAKYYSCNVTSEEQCMETVKDIKNRFGTIDILFNNAGVIRRKSVTDLTVEDWDLVVDVSMKGVFLLSKYVVPVMAENGGGSIINTGSGWGLKGGNQAVAYCAAKGGVVNMTRAMAIDHGPQGIRVNSVSPGDIDTPLLHDEARQLGQEDSEFMEEAAERPIGRVGTPMDVANAVLFFASPMSTWVTGSNLTVDGGGLA